MIRRLSAYLSAAAVLLTLIAAPARSEPVLRYAVFPAPPFMIYDERGDGASGIDVEIVTELAKRCGFSVRIIRAPWLRCLDLVRDGEADIISSAYRKSDREAYITFFDAPFLKALPIAFYTLSGHRNISRYEDIYEAGTVGVLRGASYFERFDNDSRVKKAEVSSQEFLFPMLLKGHIDVMAGYVPTENYNIAIKGLKGKVVKSTFEYPSGGTVYIGMSRKSPFAADFSALNRAHAQMLRDGTISAIVKKYYDRYR